MTRRPFIYSVMILIVILMIATFLVWIFPEANECPEGKIAHFTLTGWVCNN
jgi:hypothetical protein